MTAQIYQVDGMTCQHCAGAVTGEVGAVAGVDDVTVNLETGQVTVTGTGFTDEAIAEAVGEAGYTVVSNPQL